MKTLLILGFGLLTAIIVLALLWIRFLKEDKVKEATRHDNTYPPWGV